jgi:hypothetical protein
LELRLRLVRWKEPHSSSYCWMRTGYLIAGLLLYVSSAISDLVLPGGNDKGVF